MSKAFDTINIHTLIRKLLHTNISGTIIKFIANYIKGCILQTYRNHTSSQCQFHKVAYFHQHYSTFTLQTYHQPEHQFRSWPTQMTSPSQAQVQPGNTYNHTYKKVFAWTKQSHTKSRQNNLHSVHSRPHRM